MYGGLNGLSNEDFLQLTDLHWKLQPLCYLHDRSNCYRLERQLPGGILTH